MADVDHPKTRVENQDVDLPRTQPESPKREGIDPLTEGDTMYPAEDVKGTAEKLAREEATEPEQTPEEEVAEETVQAQEERVVNPAEAREEQKRGGFFSRTR